MRSIACPIALHPDGMPRRIAMFEDATSGLQLVQGGLANERPEASAARLLLDQSGLETRAAVFVGQSDEIQRGEVWHFYLCRIAPPVRPKWAHLCEDDGGQLFRFQWVLLDAPAPEVLQPIYQAAVTWIRENV